MAQSRPRLRLRRRIVAGFLVLGQFGPILPARGGDLVGRARARWQNHQGVPTVESLAVEVGKLERHIDCYGSIVAKQPDIWGQARLMKHRQEFEQTLLGELDKFTPSLQGSLSRTDQSFLASAFALSAALGGVAPAAPAAGAEQESEMTKSVTPKATTAGADAGAGAGDAAGEDEGNAAGEGTPAAAPAPAPGLAPLTNTAGSLISDFNDDGVIRRREVSKSTRVGFGDAASLSLEPTARLDQHARYINHLHELRRINEGDDTVDSPGYAIYRVRLPVSILPGSHTHKGFGAEITVTATPKLGPDLLPTTFRNLVINDLVQQFSTPLTEFFNSPSSLGKFQKLKQTDIDQVDEARDRLRKGRANPTLQPEERDLFVRELDSIRTVRRSGLSPARGPTANSPGGTVVYNALSEVVNKITSPSIPASRSRNSPFAYPSTQIAEVIGSGLILPVAFQAYDVLLRKAIEDTHRPQVLKFQNTVTYVQDHVAAAYDFLARPDSAPLWEAFATPELVRAVQSRDHEYLEATRNQFLDSLPNLGREDFRTNPHGDIHTTMAAFAWAILVESVMLNERLIQDIRESATAKGLPAPEERWPFFLPCPPAEAREAFNQYVRVRFPVHVFALDPVNQEQNIADELSRTRELQLALSLAFVSGNINASTMTRFARRLESEASAIALHRTQIAFSHGEDVFGWRFQPRFQTGDVPGTLGAFAQTLAGGLGRDGDRRTAELEPGMRECVALVLMPSFIPYCTFETRSNWYRLNSPKHAELDPLKILELSRTVQAARHLGQMACDSGLYRPGDLSLLLNRVNQLSAELPLQSLSAALPYENTHGGFELFNVGITDLAPQLRSWYGLPGISTATGGSLFLVGDNFSVHQTSVIVGDQRLKPFLPESKSAAEPTYGFELLSRQVMSVTVPPGLQSVVRGGQRFVEASVATPYGVSQPLFIPVVEPAPDAAAASAYAVDPDTTTLSLVYALKDGDGNPGAFDGTVDTAATPAIRFRWNTPTGAAPRQVRVKLFLEYKVGSLEIPLHRPITLTSDEGEGTYTLAATDLCRVAQQYVEQLNSLDKFTIDNPLPALTTKKIEITPVTGGTALDSQTVEADGSITFEPRPVGAITRDDPGMSDQIPAVPVAPPPANSPAPFAPQYQDMPAPAPSPAPPAPAAPASATARPTARTRAAAPAPRPAGRDEAVRTASASAARRQAPAATPAAVQPLPPLPKVEPARPAAAKPAAPKATLRSRLGLGGK